MLSRRRQVIHGFAIALLLAALGFLGVAWEVVSYGNQSVDSDADAALVLGAAAWGTKPSPVYRERIKEAIALYKRKRVRYLIFTGGTPELGYPAEGEVGRRFAMDNGVPAGVIFIETTSRNTWQNLANAKPVFASARIQSVLLVSDPLHMRRAMAMALSLGLQATPAPTSSSRFQSLASRGGFLWRETWLYID